MFLEKRLLLRRIALVGLAGLCATACSGPCDAEYLSPLAKEGCRVYHFRCTKCHHTDPKRDGNPGPATAKSSRLLLQHRLLTEDYPPGYKPKKPDSKAMNTESYRDLADKLDALTAYLEECR